MIWLLDVFRFVWGGVGKTSRCATDRMEPFFPTIWNILHDGGIDRIDGSVPGDVRVFVGIEYLRERFPDDGDEIIVCLSSCTAFSYRLYDAKHAVTDLTSIANESVTILSAEMHGSICRVFTNFGVLEMQCGGGSLSLDSGREISFNELLSVAKAFSDEWKSKSKREK